LPAGPELARATAARLLSAVVFDGRTSDQALAGYPSDPLAREMFYGAMRHHFTLAADVNAALDKPIREKDQNIWSLLVVGAYQLRYMRIPDHAAINETVSACKTLKRSWLRGLANGALRSIQREKTETERSFESEFPQWINELLRRDYPDQADAIAAANLTRAPLILRINLQRTSTSEYQASLAAAGIGCQVAFRAEHLVLDEAMSAESLPGFEAGLVAIQDAGAGFAATLLEPEPGARILDACAAPGGKLFHLMERRADIQAVALDKSAERLEHMQQEAARLGHRPLTLTGDGTNLDWWDAKEFDAILVDAPCSGSGTLRRHPDIKLLRKQADLADYARLQLQLLSNLWRTLRPGGSLLYCTCSLFTEENDAIVADFLAATNDAGVKDISLPTGIPRQFGWQLLPTDRNTDGFYFSLLNKLVTH